MLPLLGILAVLLIGLVSAGAAAGKIYNKRKWKKMKKHSKLKKQNRSPPAPSSEIEEDLEWGHPHESVDIDNDKSDELVAVAVASEEVEVDAVEELMKVHNLSGPARILFTIEEETSEELSRLDDESKKLKKKKTRKSLIDLMGESDGSMFLTPISCPVVKSTRPLTGSMFHEGDGLVGDMFDRSNLKSFVSADATSFGRMRVVASMG